MGLFDLDLGVILTAFAFVVPVELPDKTFVATLVLATRFRPLAVWLGVSLAFVVQSLVAVTAGRLLALLPEQVVHGFAALMFTIGAIILLRGARGADKEEAEQEHEFEAKLGTKAGGDRSPAGGWKAVGTSFLVLFAAEWGDLSQILTASMVARYQAPVEVFIGVVAGLILVSGIAALAGRILLRYVKLSVVRLIGGLVCATLAILTLVQLVSG